MHPSDPGISDPLCHLRVLCQEGSNGGVPAEHPSGKMSANSGPLPAFPGPQQDFLKHRLSMNPPRGPHSLQVKLGFWFQLPEAESSISKDVSTPSLPLLPLMASGQTATEVGIMSTVEAN